MTQSQPPADMTLVDERSRRELLHDRRALGLIGAGVLVVAALGYFVVLPLVHSSPADDSAAVPVHHAARVSAPASPTVAATPAAVATPAPRLNVRDPFSPLYVPVTAVAAAPTSAAPVAPIAEKTQTIVVEQPGATVTATAHSGTAKYTLKYVAAAAGNKVQVVLNGLPYTLSLGESFPNASTSPDPGPFQFTQTVAGGPAQFLYGDSPFSMLPGETQYEN